MSPADLRHLALPRFGVEWQTPLARALAISPRTVRRYAAGVSPINGDMAERIRAALGDARTPWPRAEWITGRSGRDRYLVHARGPRFIARVIQPDDSEPWNGIVHELPDGRYLSEFVWFDAPPAGRSLTALFEQAAKQVRR